MRATKDVHGEVLNKLTWYFLKKTNDNGASCGRASNAVATVTDASRFIYLCTDLNCTLSWVGVRLWDDVDDRQLSDSLLRLSGSTLQPMNSTPGPLEGVPVPNRTRVVVCAVREDVPERVNIFRVFFSTLLAGMAARCKTALPVQI
eukprot:COSAG01_NODE_2226_length_8132_cov_3.669862_2_plen_146_part_00